MKRKTIQMNTLVNASIVTNKWKPNKKYMGLRGRIRCLLKGRLEKAHGIRVTFGEKDYVIDLSYIEPTMNKIIYAVIPPIPYDTKTGLRIDTIPPDADLYPYEIHLISEDDHRKNIGVV